MQSTRKSMQHNKQSVTNDDNDNNASNQTQSVPSGVKRYKKGRSFADTLFGKMRYGKDLVTQKWVASLDVLIKQRIFIRMVDLTVKENRRWFAQNRVSIKGDPVPEDLMKEIEMMKYLMKQKDLPSSILKLLNVVEDDVYIYLVLELVDGGDFFGFIHKNHQMMEQEQQNNRMNGSVIQLWELRMRKVFFQIASAITWLHSKNVCHLDISLENALIDSNDNIKIIDFGLSKYFENGQFEMPAKRIGKPRCMSPEIFNIQKFDARLADSWAVGIMLFMMLLGIPPWSFPSENGTIYRMVKAGRIRDVIVYNNKSHMVSNDALDLLNRFFRPEKERIYLTEVLSTSFCKF